jgi:hypothetical protein
VPDNAGTVRLLCELDREYRAEVDPGVVEVEWWSSASVVL